MLWYIFIILCSVIGLWYNIKQDKRISAESVKLFFFSVIILALMLTSQPTEILKSLIKAGSLYTNNWKTESEKAKSINRKNYKLYAIALWNSDSISKKNSQIHRQTFSFSKGILSSQKKQALKILQQMHGINYACAINTLIKKQEIFVSKKEINQLNLNFTNCPK